MLVSNVKIDDKMEKKKIFYLKTEYTVSSQMRNFFDCRTTPVSRYRRVDKKEYQKVTYLKDVELVGDNGTS